MSNSVSRPSSSELAASGEEIETLPSRDCNLTNDLRIYDDGEPPEVKNLVTLGKAEGTLNLPATAHSVHTLDNMSESVPLAIPVPFTLMEGDGSGLDQVGSSIDSSFDSPEFTGSNKPNGRTPAPSSGTTSTRTSRFNHWKYVCLGMLSGIVILYLIVLAVKLFDMIGPHHNDDLMAALQKADNITKLRAYQQLSLQFYQDQDQYALPGKPTAPKNFTIPRGPIVMGTDNSFEGISTAYQNDAKVRDLMTSDNLTQTFYAMAYAPKNVISPQCGTDKRDIVLDLARMSKVTTKVRTYGTQCKQAEYILQGILELQLNMTLSLGVWVGEDDYVNLQQIGDMKELLQTYPRELFDSIYVGNEVLFREDKSANELANMIDEVKTYLKVLGYEDLPVGTSELGSLINSKVVNACDFIGVNIHPFFGGVESKDAAHWVTEYYEKQVLPRTKDFGYNKTVVVSEVGWPYAGGRYQGSTASPANMQQFLDDWLCREEKTSQKAIFFEAFDEPWKEIFDQNGKLWEKEWGFFDEDRKMKKGIKLPECAK